MRILKGSTIAALLLSLTAPAQATAGFGCEIDDETLAFSSNGTMSLSRGSPILNHISEITLKHKDSAVGPNKIDLGKSLVHHWVAHQQLFLHFYWESDGSGEKSLDLVIETKLTDDSIDYEGAYSLTVQGATAPLEISGKASCSAG